MNLPDPLSDHWSDPIEDDETIATRDVSVDYCMACGYDKPSCICITDDDEPPFSPSHCFYCTNLLPPWEDTYCSARCEIASANEGDD